MILAPCDNTNRSETCFSKMSPTSIWRKKNPEKAVEQMRRAISIRKSKRASDPEYREKMNACSRKLQKQPKWRAYHNAHARKWKKDNRDKVNAIQRKYHAKKMASDPTYVIERRLRRRLIHALKGTLKADKTLSLLGCSMGRFMEYLKAQFTEGMSFKNYGEWHIDHKTPCDAFNLTDPNQQKQCFHFTNLQPMWAVDNLKKSNQMLLAA